MSVETDFINGLELERREPVPGFESNIVPEAVTDRPSANVVAGSVIAFVAGVSAQSQSDVLNSTLLAQLNSDKLFDREARTADWYRNYTSVLGKVGWVIQDFGFAKFQSSSQGLTMDKVVLEMVKSLMSGNGLEVAGAAIKALDALADKDGRIALFKRSSQKSSGGSFQIGTASERNGALAMQLVASYMNFKTSETGVLWFSYKSSSVDIYKSGQTVTLNKDVYGQVRQSIISKLGGNAQSEIMSLDI
jgi:hypothetical protein